MDKSRFTKQYTVPAIRIAPRLCSAAIASLRDYLLNLPKTANVFDGGNGTKLIALNKEIPIEETALPQVCRDFIQQNGAELTSVDVLIGYEKLTTTEVLKEILPPHAAIPSSFETIGHIAHLNLRGEVLPFKEMIAQVILDKNPAIKTVVNKVGTIANEFRVFDMEVIGGENRMEAEVRQHGCTFKLDYSKVYWNSRLDSEHRRMVDLFIKEGDEVWDAFCGIGPFSVPAAKKGAHVFSNDLNPSSTFYLEQNAKINKVSDKISVFTGDARQFIRQMAAERPPPSAAGKNVHVLMNLPAIAVEFLDSFRRAFSRAIWPPPSLPLIHCYQFSKEEDPAKDVEQRITEILGAPPVDAVIHEVRDVAPKKQMMCFSFRLPPSVAYSDDEGENNNNNNGNNGNNTENNNNNNGNNSNNGNSNNGDEGRVAGGKHDRDDGGNQSPIKRQST